MLPAEKAKSLVDKFDNAIGHTSNDDQEKETAKVCAVICVDEILNSDIINSLDLGPCTTATRYYEQVKEQIKLL